MTASSSRAPQQARYNIDGYRIDFQYGDGRRKREWFFRFPDSDSAIGVGNNVLSRK
jgi:hypothetical protein